MSVSICSIAGEDKVVDTFHTNGCHGCPFYDENEEGTLYLCNYYGRYFELDTYSEKPDFCKVQHVYVALSESNELPEGDVSAEQTKGMSLDEAVDRYILKEKGVSNVVSLDLFGLSSPASDRQDSDTSLGLSNVPNPVAPRQYDIEVIDYDPLSKHHFISHKNCTKNSCMICDGGLGVCKVCGGFEGSLTAECLGRKLSMDELNYIYEHSGSLDGYKEKNNE